MTTSVVEKIEQLIKDALEGSEVEVESMYGDYNHLRLYVRAKEFAGKTSVQAHRMIHQILGDIVGQEVHALQIKSEVME